MTDNAIELRIEKAGLLTLIQDRGRSGYQAQGLPVGGAMDRRATRAANWLVGQEEDAPVLEMTLQGPDIQFSGAIQIAITGADLRPELDGIAAPMYRTLEIRAGQRLRFGSAQSGCRAYVAIRGQWQIPVWLGSYSALPIGGRYWPPGSRLEKGMLIAIDPIDPIVPRSVPPGDRPFHAHQLTVRVMPGPEFSWFSEAAVRYFTTHPFSVDPDSNRMGYRLRERMPDYQPQKELISSGIVKGTVQVLPAGNPVILLADAQTSGGYPRIANVVDRDLDDLGQLVPGDKVRFMMI